MLVAVDIDGTIDADPLVFLALTQALRSAGHKVAILTGCAAEKITPEDTAAKREYLQSLGFGEAYDQLVVFPDPPADGKAAWLKANRADLLIDNSKANAKAAAGICQVLVPWQTRK